MSDTRGKVMDLLTIFLGFILQKGIDVTVEKEHYHRRRITTKDIFRKICEKLKQRREHFAVNLLTLEDFYEIILNDDTKFLSGLHHCV